MEQFFICQSFDDFVIILIRFYFVYLQMSKKIYYEVYFDFNDNDLHEL